MERYFRKTKVSNGPYQRMVPCVSNEMTGYPNVMINNNNKRFSVPEPMMQVQTMEGIPFVPQPYMRTYTNVVPSGDQMHFIHTNKENNPNFSGRNFNMYQSNENREYSYFGYENLNQDYENNGGQKNVVDSNSTQYSHQASPLRPEFRSRPQALSIHETYHKQSYPRHQQMEVVEVDAQEIVSSSSSPASTFYKNSAKPNSAISKVKSTQIGNYFSSTRTSLSPSMQNSTLSEASSNHRNGFSKRANTCHKL